METGRFSNSLLYVRRVRRSWLVLDLTLACVVGLCQRVQVWVFLSFLDRFIICCCIQCVIVQFSRCSGLLESLVQGRVGAVNVELEEDLYGRHTKRESKNVQFLDSIDKEGMHDLISSYTQDVGSPALNLP